MRSVTSVSAALLVLVPFLSTSLAAQEGFSNASGLPAFPPEEQQDEGGPSWQSRIFTAMGGAVVGAGLGFFASQVAAGDWDEGADVDRPAWAAVGGSLGFAMGLSFPLGGQGRLGPEVIEVGRDMILGEEIRQTASVRNMYEAVEILRPEWLVLRGTRSWRETPRENISGMRPGVSSASADEQRAEGTLRVYLDDVLLGGIESLRDIGIIDVKAVRFVQPAAATARWGTGHVHGAILVETR